VKYFEVFEIKKVILIGITYKDRNKSRFCYENLFIGAAPRIHISRNCVKRNLLGSEKKN
jgi:hypothetical protein